MTRASNADLQEGRHTLTRGQVAKRLGLSTSSIRRLEFVRLHPVNDSRGVWRFDPAEVETIEPRAGLRARRSRTASDAKSMSTRVRGRVAASIFKMFAAGQSLAQIVIATQQHPETVRALFSEWSTTLADGEWARRRGA